MTDTTDRTLYIAAAMSVAACLGVQLSRFSPIGTVFALAIYFIFWWVTLFGVLPFGVRTQHDEGNVVQGTSAGAPIHTRMGRVAAWTTIVTSVVFLLALVALAFRLIPLEPLQ